MHYSHDVNLTDLLFSLSQAMEIAHADISNHQLRTAYIVWRMGAYTGLPIERLERLFVAASLHDIGALSPEEKLLVHDFEDFNPATHSNRGALLFSNVPLLAPSAAIVKHHHRRWDTWDCPLSGDPVMESQMLALADLVERRIDRSRFILHQQDQIIRYLRSLAGTVLHKEVIELFLYASTHEEFWLNLMSPDIMDILRRHIPFRHVTIERERVFAISEIFRTVIDFRSPNTATHSSGVASCAVALGRLFGLTDYECQSLELAGNLHDIGKLVVPDSILHKPGALNKEENATLRQHPYMTYSVLSTVRGFERIVEYAAFHHEQLSGEGYPFHICEKQLSTGARIIAVADVFTALNEDRSYRKRMSLPNVVSTLKRYAATGHLDPALVDLLLKNMDAVRDEMIQTQSMSLDYYHQQFVTTEEDARQDVIAASPTDFRHSAK